MELGEVLVPVMEKSFDDTGSWHGAEEAISPIEDVSGEQPILTTFIERVEGDIEVWSVGAEGGDALHDVFVDISEPVEVFMGLELIMVVDGVFGWPMGVLSTFEGVLECGEVSRGEWVDVFPL